MAVKIRLARNILTRNSPSYTIVAIPSSLRTTAKPLEVLGTYASVPVLLPPISISPNGQERNIKDWGARQYKKVGKTEIPGEKLVVWNEARVRYWLSEGAMPSKSVESLLIKAGILCEFLPSP